MGLKVLPCPMRSQEPWGGGRGRGHLPSMFGNGGRCPNMRPWGTRSSSPPSALPPLGCCDPSGGSLPDGQQHRRREVPRLPRHTSSLTSLRMRVWGQYVANSQFSETLGWGLGPGRDNPSAPCPKPPSAPHAQSFQVL